MSRLAYFTRETLISLRRNLLMTIAGIITVAVSLFLFGGTLLVQRTVDHGTAKWKNGVELEIFMRNPVPETQIDDVRTALGESPDVKNFRFLNHEDAYSEFKKIFRDQPALIESTSPEDLPTSFRVAPQTAEQTAEIANRFATFTGVDEVITAQEQVDRLLTATRVIRIGFWAIAGLLLASSLFLIVNTIRLATFARRREIEVMKLVGASNWFVRIPFMAEGLIQGAIGAGLAIGGVYFIKVIVTNLLDNRDDLLQVFYVTNADAFWIAMVVLLIGAGIGALGSAIGLRRFLDV
jgi:cell division transport system permease protein